MYIVHLHGMLTFRKVWQHINANNIYNNNIIHWDWDCLGIHGLCLFDPFPLLPFPGSSFAKQRPGLELQFAPDRFGRGLQPGRAVQPRLRLRKFLHRLGFVGHGWSSEICGCVVLQEPGIRWFKRKSRLDWLLLMTIEGISIVDL